MALIPQSETKCFTEVQFDYIRKSPPDAGTGILANITKIFPKDFNIWRLTNYTSISEPNYEEGSFKFLIEDRITKKLTEEEFKDRIKQEFQKIKNSTFNTKFDLEISEIKVDPISHNKIKDKVNLLIEKRKNYKHDVFLSYCNKDSKDAENIEKMFDKYKIKWFDSKKIKGGELYKSAIREALKDSMEMCLLYTPNAKDSQWIFAEFGAGWVLDKRITPIIKRIDNKDLPDFINMLNVIDYHNIEKYCREVKERSFNENYYL